MAKDGLRRQGCCDGHSPRSVSVLPGELKALVRRNALKLSHDRFPYRFGTASIRRWAGFLDEREWLWEGWKDLANGEWLHTCTIITGEPNEFVREIHTRMPVILPDEYHDSWLSGEAGKEILVPFPADWMKAWRISSRVNSPKNNDAEIIAPIELQRCLQSG